MRGRSGVDRGETKSSSSVAKIGILLSIFRIKESKVCIQLSLSIHQETRDEIRQNPLKNWRKTTFLNGMTNIHNRGPK